MMSSISISTAGIERRTSSPWRYSSSSAAEITPNYLWNKPLDYPTLINLDPTKSDLGLEYLPVDHMQSEAWVPSPQGQLNSRYGQAGHQRNTSMSSLASTAGPASPFSQNTTNPHIAMADYRHQDLPDMASGAGQENPEVNPNYSQLGKSTNTFPGYQNLDQAIPELAYPVTLSSLGGRPRANRGGLLAAPEFSNGSSRSQPTSAASSVTSDSPATPNNGELDQSRRRRGYSSNVPKLDRTMTDVYGDELYSPNFAITSSSNNQAHFATSPSDNEIFNQRLNAANSQHLSVSNSPASSNSRDKSPFCVGSPHSIETATTMPLNSRQTYPDQNKVMQGSQTLQPQFGGRDNVTETPKTISPKDAMLEFNDTEGNTTIPLFPPEGPSPFDMELSKAIAQQMIASQAVTTNGLPANMMPTDLPGSLPIPQQYPFIARNHTAEKNPTRINSADMRSSESGVDMSLGTQRPVGRHADGGTYTCTYHGCTLRFETPAMLQKHKREGHRQTQGLGVGREGVTSSLLNSQAGPHRCDRINPSTNKPCHTVFSRPYDLTRHEDTIHNARKRKVRCDLCTEDKTFSRADALTRHYRVCHPNAELPTKHGRRNGGV